VLHVLAQLDIIDKHRLLIVTVSKFRLVPSVSPCPAESNLFMKSLQAGERLRKMARRSSALIFPKQVGYLEKRM
jgi:hypothetical protein